MANFCFNQGKQYGLKELYEAAQESPPRLKVLLIQAGSEPSSPDVDTVADIVGGSPTAEVTASGYARQALSNVTLNVDDANDFAYLDADDVLFSGMTTGQDVGGALLYLEVTNDADSIPIAWYEFSSAIDTGNDISVRWNTPANGGVLKDA